MLGAVLWCCLEIAANILTRNKFNTLAIKHGQLSRFTASHIICLCYKYPFILHDELNFLSNIKFEILPGENLILGSYLQCNRRTKPDPKLKPIWTQGNYTQGYLRQKASVTATNITETNNENRNSNRFWISYQNDWRKQEMTIWNLSTKVVGKRK